MSCFAVPVGPLTVKKRTVYPWRSGQCVGIVCILAPLAQASIDFYMHVTLYHNPRCSKSREALALLQARGITPEVVLYLETPPDSGTLQVLLKKLRLPARSLLRTKEQEYDDLGLADPTLSDTQIINAIVQHPRLLERPIAVAGERAVIGRPPEAILALIE